jgi:hypothetical protein
LKEAKGGLETAPRQGVVQHLRLRASEERKALKADRDTAKDAIEQLESRIPQADRAFRDAFAAIDTRFERLEAKLETVASAYNVADSLWSDLESIRRLTRTAANDNGYAGWSGGSPGFEWIASGSTGKARKSMGHIPGMLADANTQLRELGFGPIRLEGEVDLGDLDSPFWGPFVDFDNEKALKVAAGRIAEIQEGVARHRDTVLAPIGDRLAAQEEDRIDQKLQEFALSSA